jgi:hypothetical protein
MKGIGECGIERREDTYACVRERPSDIAGCFLACKRRLNIGVKGAGRRTFKRV